MISSNNTAWSPLYWKFTAWDDPDSARGYGSGITQIVPSGFAVKLFAVTIRLPEVRWSATIVTIPGAPPTGIPTHPHAEAWWKYPLSPIGPTNPPHTGEGIIINNNPSTSHSSFWSRWASIRTIQIPENIVFAVLGGHIYNHFCWAVPGRDHPIIPTALFVY